MPDKVILVTGANRGIGLEIVRQLAAQGCTVLLGTRDEAKGRLAADSIPHREHVHSLKLDITNEADVDAAAKWIRERYGRLDVLINNAAILLKTDQNVLDDDEAIFQETLATNVYAHLHVTRALQSLIPAGGSIIMTSSGGGSMSDPVGGWSPAYCISKSTLNAITRHLAYTLQARRIRVNAFCPGWVRTDMGGKSAPRRVEQGADTAVWLATADVRESGKFFRDRHVIPW